MILLYEKELENHMMKNELSSLTGNCKFCRTVRLFTVSRPAERGGVCSYHAGKKGE